KLALSVLSALSVTDLISAVQAGDVDKLATVPGIGKKSAGRIALELKDKVERLHPTAFKAPDAPSTQTNRMHEDALSALVNLGYRAPEVKDVLRSIGRSGPAELSLQDLIRDALKDLARR
ncbi:MAG: Holliday junction branch migration protein RuvA, partial [Nitrospiraceae bacterium]